MSYLHKSIFLLAVMKIAYADRTNGHIYSDSPQARKIFHLADKDNNSELVYSEFQQVFADFDTDHNGRVNSTEFIKLWLKDDIGPVQQGVTLFLNIDVNKDFIIDQVQDLLYLFKFFDRDANKMISEDEFVIQWMKMLV